jgi:hypothetical protein
MVNAAKPEIQSNPQKGGKLGLDLYEGKVYRRLVDRFISVELG